MGAIICEATLPPITKEGNKELILDKYSYDMALITQRDTKTLQTISKPSTPLKENNFNIDIEKIISLNKLHTKNDNEVLFISNLELFSDDNRTYKPLFCVLTRVFFISYEKKIDFLSMRKPISKIHLESIESVEAIQYKSKWHFSILLRPNQFKLKYQGMNDEIILKWVVVMNYFIGIASKRKGSIYSKDDEEELKAIFFK